MLAELTIIAQLTTADIELDVQSFRIRSGVAEIFVKVTNNRPAPAFRVFVECDLLDSKGVVVEIARGIISNVGPKQTVAGRASNVSPTTTSSAQCRVSQVTD